LPACRPSPTARLEELQDEAASLAAHIASATGRLLEILGELGHRGGWGEGFVSLAHWLSWRTGMRLGAAREHVRVASALRDLPRTAAALSRGELSYSKARAITRVARPESEERFVEMARYASASQLERILRAFRRAHPQLERERAKAVEDRRGLSVYHDDDGMLVLSARLAPDEGARFLGALDAARKECSDRAGALVLMAERSVSAETESRSPRAQVVVHVDAEVLRDPEADGRSHLEHGPDVPAETSRRLSCDADVLVAIHGTDGEISVGRRTRVPSPRLRRALHLRDDGHCQFPGCSNRIVDAHHVHPWTDGGPTVLSNLLTLCRSHHVLVHELGYHVELGPDGPRFFRPDGRPFPTVPPLPHVPAPEPRPWALAPVNYSSRYDLGAAVSAL
jgi:hypothetical protein